MFQSTHPHGVRPDTPHIVRACPSVSIHAPARGATLSVIADTLPGEVSIHAPARGATKQQKMLDAQKAVSIHAPARGATKLAPQTSDEDKFQSTHPHGVRHSHIRLIYLLLLFQSTHPHGVRLGEQFGSSISELFQSTHPHGVRQGFIIKILGQLSFNPRTRTGCDSVCYGPH